MTENIWIAIITAAASSVGSVAVAAGAYWQWVSKPRTDARRARTDTQEAKLDILVEQIRNSHKTPLRDDLDRKFDGLWDRIEEKFNGVHRRIGHLENRVERHIDGR